MLILMTLFDTASITIDLGIWLVTIQSTDVVIASFNFWAITSYIDIYIYIYIYMVLEVSEIYYKAVVIQYKN